MRSLGNTAAAGWPVSATLAIALLSQSMRLGRRRSAINRALHELRRPLHALALAIPSSPTPSMAGGSLDLAIAALSQLDAEVNGSRRPQDPVPARCKGLLESAVARWRSRAALAGGSIDLSWTGPEGVLIFGPAALAQAVDNLIVNAIEHGGPKIIVEAAVRGQRIRIRVSDSGRHSRDGWRRETPRETISRLTGRRRRGHGLGVVRQMASAQGGRFVLQRSDQGSVAALELPLAGGGERMRAA
jgi:signal transduction histidine kinase